MKKKKPSFSSKRHTDFYRRYWFIFVFALIGALLAYRSYAAVSPVNYSIIVVAGQSNADGAESYVSDPTTNFDLFTKQAHPADATTKLIWSNLTRSSGPPPVVLNSIGSPAGKYSTDQANFGPEVGLARGLYDQGRRNVLILKVSYGGLSLATKDGSDWNVNSPNEAYSILVSRMKDVKKWVAGQGGTASVDGFYWVQGESDANPTFAPLYEQNLRNLVARARVNLGMANGAPFVIAKTSIVPWIQTAQAITQTNPCGATSCEALAAADAVVRSAQQKVADTTPNTKIVDTLPLPRHGFKMHLSNQGELQLGALFAQVTATSKPSATTSTPISTPQSSSRSGKATITSPTASSKTTSPNSPSDSTTLSQQESSSPAPKSSEAVAGLTKTKKSPEKRISIWQRIKGYLQSKFDGIRMLLIN